MGIRDWLGRLIGAPGGRAEEVGRTTPAPALRRTVEQRTAAFFWGAPDNQHGRYLARLLCTSRRDSADLMLLPWQTEFGSPVVLDPAWLTRNDGWALKIARSIAEQDQFDDLPILADALEDAGCGETELLTHCRAARKHEHGCWVLDLILDREADTDEAEG
jgi:soluble lytic murein transglycosylase-like protein